MTVEIAEFGRTRAGQVVRVATLRSGALTVRVLTLGAILQDLRLAAVGRSLTLGSDSVADYEGAMRFHGSLIAPVALSANDPFSCIASWAATIFASASSSNSMPWRAA